MTSLTSCYGTPHKTWSQNLFSANREKLILQPVKFQIYIISRSTKVVYRTTLGVQILDVAKGGRDTPQ